MIQVKLKRKLEYKNVHKHEYIDPQKIFKALELLKKKGHPYYKFYDDYNTFKCRWAKEGLRDPNNQKKIKLKFIEDTQITSILDLKNKKGQPLFQPKMVETSDQDDDDELKKRNIE